METMTTGRVGVLDLSQCQSKLSAGDLDYLTDKWMIDNGGSENFAISREVNHDPQFRFEKSMKKVGDNPRRRIYRN